MRQPAACCNIIGYLPTQHRYSSEGVFPLTNATDTVGLMSNDIQEIMDVDYALTYSRKSDADYPSFEQIYENIKVEGIKIGVPKTYFQDDVAPNIMVSVQGTLDVMDQSGHFRIMHGNDECFGGELFKQQLPFMTLFGILAYEFPREAAYYLDKYRANMTVEELLNNSTGLEREMCLSLLDRDSEVYVDSKKYHQLLEGQRMYKDVFVNYMKGNDLDVFIYPTMNVEPPLAIEEETMMQSHGNEYPTMMKCSENTVPTALIGFPCITIPGVRVEGSKFRAGFELCGLPGSDAKLLKIAAHIIKMTE